MEAQARARCGENDRIAFDGLTQFSSEMRVRFQATTVQSSSDSRYHGNNP